MRNLNENEILAEFRVWFFLICTLCIIYGQKSPRPRDLVFCEREGDLTIGVETSLYTLYQHCIKSSQSKNSIVTIGLETSLVKILYTL